jgi:hypothetical protein
LGTCMETNAATSGTVIGIVIGASGLLAAILCAVWGVHATRSYSRHKLAVEMRPGYQLRPTSFGLGARLQMEYDGRSVGELRVFFLAVRNSGKRDILQEINPARRAAGVVFPSIEFVGLRVAGYHTVQNKEEDFYIALSKSKSDTKLWLNIEKIRRGKTAEFQIVCIPNHLPPDERLEDTGAILHVGYIPDLEVEALGILKPAK